MENTTTQILYSRGIFLGRVLQKSWHDAAHRGVLPGNTYLKYQNYA